MKSTLTLEFDSPAELAAAVAKLTAIAYQDRPDVGVEPPRPPAATPAPVPAPAVNPLGFGLGVTLPAGATPALPDAAAAPSPTAPAAPPASSTAPPATPAPAPLPALAVPAAPPAPPPAPAAPTPPAASAADRDSNGLPWDHRIHAGSRGVNKDGTWKAKKLVSNELKAQVEAELRQGLTVNAALAPAAVAAPPAPGVPPAPPAPGRTGSGLPVPTDFPTLMEMFAAAMAGGRITTADIQAALAPYGLASMGQLSYTENAVAPVAQALAHLL